MRQNEFVIDLQQTVEHARPGEGRVFLDRQHGAEAVLLVDRRLGLHGPLAEMQPRRADIVAQPDARQAHAPRHAAGQHGVEELGGLRIGLAIAIGDAERACAVLLKFVGDVADQVFQLGDRFPQFLVLVRAAACSIEQSLDGFACAECAAHAGAHDGEVEFIGEHALLAQLIHVAPVEQIAEGIVEVACQLRFDLSPDDGRPQAKIGSIPRHGSWCSARRSAC